MNTDKKIKLIGTIVGILLFIVLIAGISYAWFSWRSSNVNIAGTTECFDIHYTNGQTLTNANTILFDETKIISNGKVTIKNGMALTDMTAYIDSSCNITANLEIILNVTDLNSAFIDGDSVGAFKYVLASYDPSVYSDITTTALNGQQFDIIKNESITSTGEITLVDTLMPTKKTGYLLLFYVDGDLAMNDAQYSTFTATITGVATQVEHPTLIKHIVNLYNDASKTTVPNNGITYNYATSVGLMNDRLGTMSVGADAGNIRYYGATPNNYIDIGDVYEGDYTFNNWEKFGWYYENTEECYLDNNYCDTEWSDWGYEDVKACYEEAYGIGFSSAEDICGTTTFSKGTPILYRIIGLFKNVELADGSRKDLIKVMRNDTIGNYSWDQSESTVNYGYGVNEWSQADLMKLLNPGYGSETVGGSLYWNSGSGTCYGWDLTNEEYTSIPCDFTNKGLSTSARGKIETVKWNLGGWNNESVYANQIYEYERQGNVVIPGTTCSGSLCNDGITRKTEWPGKVALAYPSDYGYAVDLRSCSSQLNGYKNCIGTNWMYPRMTFGGGMNSWLLTPNSDDATLAWHVYAGGGVYVYNGFVDPAHEVSPVFYLDSELVIESGDGSSGNPYMLS